MIRWLPVLLAGCWFAPDPPPGASRHWELRAGASQPGALTGPALTYDPAGQRVILFGGSSGTTVFGKTWVLGADGWTEICTSGTAPLVADAGFAYDRVRNRVVVIGGSADPTGTMVTAAAAYCDLATDQWMALPALAQPRAFGYLVADDAGRLFVFGGIASSGDDLQDALRSDDGGMSWTPIASPPFPSGWNGAGAVFDPDHGRILVLQEDPANDLVQYYAGFFDALWELRDDAWNEVCHECGLQRRAFAALGHVRTADETYLIGGYAGSDPLDESGVFDQGGWVKVSGDPPLRDSMGVAYDEARDRLVIYGGNGHFCQGSGGDCNETWELVGH